MHIKEPSTVRTAGTDPSITEAAGAEPSHIQPSGTQALLSPPSDEQAQVPLPLGQPKEATSPVKTLSSLMPSFTSLGPGTTRIASPVRGSNLKAPTITHRDEITCPVRLARLNDIAEQHRNGTWDGIPRDMKLVVDSDGNQRLKRITKDEGTIKSKDGQKTKEATALLNLGRPKTAANKSGSDDEGLSQALDDMLGGREINPKGSVTPLQSLIGGDDDPNNKTNYSDPNSEDEHDYLGCFEGAQFRLCLTETISHKTHNNQVSR